MRRSPHIPQTRPATASHGWRGGGAFDPDDDGLTNLQEYLAGTDPTNAASGLRLEVPTLSGGVRVRFSAVSNHTYSVLYADQLPAGSWTKLADVPARSTNHVETIPDPSATTNRFYRVVVPMQP